MNAILMNCENSKTSDSHRLLLKFSDKIDLKRSGKEVDLSNLSIECTWTNIKKSYKDNNFKISGPTCIETSELSEGAQSASDIQDQKNEKVTDNPPIRIYLNQ